MPFEDLTHGTRHTLKELKVKAADVIIHTSLCWRLRTLTTKERALLSKVKIPKHPLQAGARYPRSSDTKRWRHEPTRNQVTRHVQTRGLGHQGPSHLKVTADVLLGLQISPPPQTTSYSKACAHTPQRIVCVLHLFSVLDLCIRCCLFKPREVCPERRQMPPHLGV